MPASITARLKEEGIVPYEITLHMIFAEREKLFHCIYCKFSLFKQQARVLNVFMAGGPEEMKVVTIPVSIQCQRCGCIYHISTINL